MNSQLISILKSADIVQQREVTLKNGSKSDFYIDVKKAYGSPLILRMIAEEMFNLFDKKTNVVAVNGYGGLALGGVISEKYNLNLTMVRDTEKKHGLTKWIDGYVPNKEDYLALVDDVWTTGGSMNKMENILTKHGARIIGKHVVVSRSESHIDGLTFICLAKELIL